jgi:N-acetylglutamate synthase-like GNAT family acetyltransferase
MTLLIRSAFISERPVLIALQRRAALANPGDRDALLAHPEMVDTPEEQFAAGNVLVAEEDGDLVGFAALYVRKDGDAELDGLFVEPDMWRRGVGRTLVEASAKRAGALGARKLSTVGNPHAEGFYLRLGFRITGTFETRFGTGLLMERPLVQEYR